LTLLINILVRKWRALNRSKNLSVKLNWRLAGHLVYVEPNNDPSSVLSTRSMPSIFALRIIMIATAVWQWRRGRFSKRRSLHSDVPAIISATLEKRRHENTASGCPRFPQFTGLSPSPPFSFRSRSLTLFRLSTLPDSWSLSVFPSLFLCAFNFTSGVVDRQVLSRYRNLQRSQQTL